MSSKGIKIAAWISIAVNGVALLSMVSEGGDDVAAGGILYALGMQAVSVVSLLGASEWDKQSKRDGNRIEVLTQQLGQPTK